MSAGQSVSHGPQLPMTVMRSENSTTPFSMMSAMHSQASGMELPLRSAASPNRISQESLMPLLLQSLVSLLHSSHSSGMPLASMSWLARVYVEEVECGVGVAVDFAGVDEGVAICV